jgi:hypothetical protein
MNMFRRLLLVAAVIGIGFWIWTAWFPNPKQIIKNRLNEVARLASFTPNEGAISRLAKIQRLGLYFAEDVQVMVDIPGYESHTFNRREEVMQVVMASPRLGSGLSAQFLDMNIQVGTGDDSAMVDLTLAAKITGESDLLAQELNFTLKKIKGEWLITRVETIKTLKP